jgi:hypothetical protein
MRQGVRSHRTYLARGRRLNKRSAVILVLATAATFGVALVAFSGSAVAQVPDCTAKASTGNDSCLNLNVTPSNAPATFTGGQRLFVHTKTVFTQPSNCGAGGCLSKVTLDFDNDFRISPGTIPTCSPAKAYGYPNPPPGGQNIAAVWAACGPDAGPAGNAYLSTQIAPTAFGCTANPCVSGLAEALVPESVTGCVLIFNGPRDANNNPTVTVYTRSPISPGGCLTDPASNPFGSADAILKGTITTSPLAGYGKRLALVPSLNTPPLPLDHFFAYLKRGSYFQARCPAGTSPWKIRGLFHYSGSGEADDVIAPPYAGTTQACS